MNIACRTVSGISTLQVIFFFIQEIAFDEKIERGLRLAQPAATALRTSVRIALGGRTNKKPRFKERWGQEINRQGEEKSDQSGRKEYRELQISIPTLKKSDLPI